MIFTSESLLFTGMVVAVLTLGVLLGLSLHQLSKRRAASKRDDDIQRLRWSLGLEGGNQTRAGPEAAPEDADAIWVDYFEGIEIPPVRNGSNLAQDESGEEAERYTAVVEPVPFFGTRVSVRQSWCRASRHLAALDRAMGSGNLALAGEFANASLQEVRNHLRHDSWYTAWVVNHIGCLRFEQARELQENGFTEEAIQRYAEARAFWEWALQDCSEWFEQCHELIPTVRSNLSLIPRIWGSGG